MRSDRRLKYFTQKYWFRFLRGPIARGAIGTLGVNAVSAALGFLTTILLARTLDASGYGAFAFGRSCIGIFILPTIFGFRLLLVRELPGILNRQEWSLMRGLILRTDHIVVCLCAVLIPITLAVVWLAAPVLDPTLVVGIYIALGIVPISTLLHLRQGAMRGLHHSVMAQVPHNVVRPLMFLILVVVAYFALDKTLSAPVALILFGGATFVALGVSVVMRSSVVPSRAKTAPPLFRTRRWLRDALPLFFSGSLLTISMNLDLILLGILQGTEQVGQYGVAKSVVGLILFARRAINAPFGPKIASLYSQGATDELQAIVTKSARAVLFFALPLAIGCIFFGDWILRIFGPEFTRAATVLAILSLGQLFSGAMGSLSLLLQMTQNAGEAAKATTVGIIVNIGLTCLLVPLFGMEGAAVAAVAGIITRDVIMAIIVNRRIGVTTTARGH